VSDTYAVDRLLHARYQFHVYLFLYRMGHVMCQVELKLTVPRLHLTTTTMSITIRPARVRIPLPVSTETKIH
jgi:hypothetical protein